MNPSAAEKYLTFTLGKEEYAIPILKVHEIIGVLDVTPVPRVPAFLKGVINLRGKIVPVIDLRTKFGMPETPRTETTCIIVVETANGDIGAIVDAVQEVRKIAASDIEAPPSFGISVETEFLLGVGKASGRVQLLLDIERVLSSSESELAGKLSKPAPDA